MTDILKMTDILDRFMIELGEFTLKNNVEALVTYKLSNDKREFTSSTIKIRFSKYPKERKHVNNSKDD